jgi:multidrug efflux system outer membrane protein
MTMNTRIPAVLATIAVLLAGCAVGPDYRKTDAKLPAAWHGLSAVGDASTTVGGKTPLAKWWTTFRDPVLDSLVDRALAANTDLHLAQSRVREARAARGVAEAELGPTVDAAGSWTRTRGGLVAPRAEGDLFLAGFDVSWEIDVFGGVRREIEAADADLAATVEERRDVLVTVIAEVARNYVELRGSQRSAAIARANLRAQRETLDLTRTRLEAGLATDLDGARAEAQVRTTAAEIPALESAARRSVHALGVLLGREPGALVAELSREAPVPQAPAEVPVGLPSDLLRRRPDVRRAERQLAAATARIGVAAADLYPRFSLTGSFGVAGTDSGDMLGSDGPFWSVGPAVRWSLLDFGRVRSRIAVQGAREEQAAIAYEGTILRSLREVEDALVSFSREQARRQELAGAVESGRRAVGLAGDLYRQGKSDFLSVLQAQRDLFVSEDALVRSDRTVATTLVSLYKALGGGWEIESRATDRPPAGEPGARVLDMATRAIPVAPPGGR